MTEKESEAIAAMKKDILSHIDEKMSGLVTKEQLLEIIELEKAQLDIFDTIYQKSSTVSAPTKDKLTLLHNEALKRVAKLEEEGEQV